MPRTDPATLRAEYESLSHGDWDSLLRDAQPDFELRPPAQGLDASVYRGRDAAVQAFMEFFGPYEEVHVDPQEFFDRGDRIVVFFLQRCRPRGSSAMVEVRAAHLWTMRDGRAARLEIFPDRDRALAAAGVT